MASDEHNTREVTTIEGDQRVIQTDIINVRQMRFASSRFISRRDNNGINTRERDNAEPRTKRFITNRESRGIPRDKGKCGEPGTPYTRWKTSSFNTRFIRILQFSYSPPFISKGASDNTNGEGRIPKSNAKRNAGDDNIYRV